MTALVTPDALVADLRAAGDVITDPDVLEAYRRDQAAPALLAAGTPAVLVRPRTTSEAQAAVVAAGRHGVPVVPRGAGSGLAGGANAIDGCMVLSLERMTSVKAIDSAALTATVGPGLLNADLGRAAAEEGLWYPPDPASWEFSTLGGNVATNAGGLCCVKYGVTRDSLLALEVVMADGRALRVGHKTRKGVAGYDLTALLCGSEGTLAVITEVTVRLQPPAPKASTLAASFPSLLGAGEAIARIARETRPSLLEVMDATTVAAVEDFQPQDLDRDVAALLFARGEDPLEVAHMERLCEGAGASLVVTSDEEAEGRMLMAARRLAYPALERRGATLLDDVAVPIPAIPALIEGISRISEQHGVLIATFGHAGDGNMHPTIVYDHADPEEVGCAKAAFDAMLVLAIELGGTVAGEHGIGVLKRDHLRAELGDALDVCRAIKHALDPAGLLNPGKSL